MRPHRKALITGSIGLIALTACGASGPNGPTTQTTTAASDPAAGVERDACGAIATFINTDLSQAMMNAAIGEAVKPVLDRATHADTTWTAAARRLLKATTSPNATAADAEPFMNLCASNGWLTVGGK